ncbi:MAG: PmoA family protein, partial [Pyrinomonadaceae bacterium]
MKETFGNMKFPRSPGYRMVPTAALILAGAVLINAQEAQNNQGVSIVPVDSARRVDIFIDGKPFTSYIFSEDLRKPVLFPLHASSGTIVTRGFPLEPRAGERVDHPHHVGLWFNYESVNGVDFWNNSTARNPQEQAKMGTIYHRQIKRAQNGRENGELVTESDWIMPDKSRVITEHTDFIFRKSLNDPKIRIIDRIATLTAQDTRVEFKDAKDGMLGLRVARQLEQPS